MMVCRAVSLSKTSDETALRFAQVQLSVDSNGSGTMLIPNIDGKQYPNVKPISALVACKLTVVSKGRHIRDIWQGGRKYHLGAQLSSSRIECAHLLHHSTMGKRSSEADHGNKKKFRVAHGVIEPGYSGVYATCLKNKEGQCRKELLALFQEKAEEYFDMSQVEGEGEDDDDESLSIEDKIKREVNELNQTTTVTKKEPLKPINLDCMCLVFIKTRKPIDPERLVYGIVKELAETKVKRTRVTNKLLPVTYTVSASIDQLKLLAEKVLKPHFHSGEDQKPVKYAIQVDRRNFNTIAREDVIKTVASCIDKATYGHEVELKQYEKLILVNCYKNSIGMSVVDDWLKYDKYNLQQIYEKGLDMSQDSSRVSSEPAKLK